jgi:cell division protein FtsA
MSKGKNYNVSIDVGTSSLKGVITSLDATGRQFLEAYGSVKSAGIEKSGINDAVALKGALRKLVDGLIDQMPKKDIIADFYVSFSEMNYSVLSENVEEIISDGEPAVIKEETIKELLENIEQEKFTRGNIKIHKSYIRKYILDDEKIVFNPVEMKASKINLEIVYISSEGRSSEIFKRIFEELYGSGVFNIRPSLVSAAESVLTDKERQHGVMCVTLGHSVSEIICYKENLPVYISQIPLGIKNIIKDVSKVLETSFDEAEKLLVTYGDTNINNSGEERVEYFALDGRTRKSVSMRKLSRVVYARVRELFNKIRRELGIFYTENKNITEDKLPGGIVITGGGAKLRGLTDTGVETLRMPVRVGTYETSFNPRIENSDDVSNDPMFSACLGNLLESTEKGVLEEAPLSNEEDGKVKEKEKKGFGDIIKSIFFGGEEE